MDRVLIRVSFVILILASLFLILVSYWLFWPYKIYTVHNVEVINEPVKAGDYAQVRLHSTKHAPLPATVIRILHNEYAYNYTPVDSDVDVGEADWVIKIKIPDTCPTGDHYVIKTTYIYRPNPIRTVNISWQTKPFTVEAK